MTELHGRDLSNIISERNLKKNARKMRKFRDHLTKLHNKSSQLQVNLRVHRDNIVEETFHQLKIVESLKGYLSIFFEGENGLDAGGLMREWFSTITKSILTEKSNNKLFVEYDGLYHPNLCCKSNKHLE